MDITLKKYIVNTFLILALSLSLYLVMKTICVEEWHTSASTLAVITAIIASWSAQRVIWKQEEALEPNLNVYLDVNSLSDVSQLVVENSGGSSCFNVKIKWEKPL